MTDHRSLITSPQSHGILSFVTPAKGRNKSRRASPPHSKVSTGADLLRPEYFVNRELSWLAFNERVLEEAQDPATPLLERLKFLAIVSSNLDEFFEIRVAGLQQQAESHPQRSEVDGLTAEATLGQIAGRARRQVDAQYRCYNEELCPGLRAAGIALLTMGELDEAGRQWAANYYQRQVSPVLTPLGVDPAHPFPQLRNKSLNLAVMLGEVGAAGTRFGIVQVPRVLPRLVPVPGEVGPAGSRGYLFLSSLISAFIGELFPGLVVQGCYAFRVTRNSELYLDEDEADNLLEAMQEQLQRRRRGDAVRLEVQRGCHPTVVGWLLETFELEAIDLYEVDGPINLTRLMAVYEAHQRPDLKDPPFTPSIIPALHGVENARGLFEAVSQSDLLLHHPYDSFRPVVDFVSWAADDPQVLAIKQTLYRTSSNSPILRALMRAAQNGKQVTALVELKARFDEENNIQWAQAMEEAGVHVLYGLVGLKTHCKLALVVRREDDTVRRYVHLGTGNYNEMTARLYTDLGLLTADPVLGEEVATVFNLLTGISHYQGLDQLLMAPFNMKPAILGFIEREAAHARRARARKKGGGAGRPRIIAKMNALVDPDIIQALYRASQAGVQIDLVVRGICCLRPGLAGVSERIRVISIVDRFLEHSRLFYFANAGQSEIYCGSADWMPRNFHRRVEILFPVHDAALGRRLLEEVLEPALRDNVKARVLQPDGSYRRVPIGTGPAFRSQTWLLEQAAQPVAGPTSVEPLPAPGPLLLPLLAPPEGRAGTAGDPILRSLFSAVRDTSTPYPAPPPEDNNAGAGKAPNGVARERRRRPKKSRQKTTSNPETA